MPSGTLYHVYGTKSQKASILEIIFRVVPVHHYFFYYSESLDINLLCILFLLNIGTNYVFCYFSYCSLCGDFHAVV